MNDIYNIALHFEDTEDILKDFEKQVSEYNHYSVKKYGKPFLKAFKMNRYKINTEKYTGLYETRGQSYFGTLQYCDSLGVEQSYEHFKPLDIIEFYFLETIDMCLDEGINVIIETIPMNKATYEACSEKYLDEYSNYMKQLQTKYPKITINEKLTYYDNEYFGDETHFNQKGVKKYTEYLKEQYPQIFKEK